MTDGTTYNIQAHFHYDVYIAYEDAVRGINSAVRNSLDTLAGDMAQWASQLNTKIDVTISHLSAAVMQELRIRIGEAEKRLHDADTTALKTIERCIKSIDDGFSQAFSELRTSDQAQTKLRDDVSKHETNVNRFRSLLDEAKTSVKPIKENAKV